MSSIHLTIKNQFGSVQHYYHFMVGFLVPLVQTMSDIELRAETKRVFIKTCDIMDGLIREIAFSKLVILPKDEHLSLATAATGPDGEGLGRMVVEGYDDPSVYDKGVFARVSAELGRRLSGRIAIEHDLLAARLNGAGPRIVLIDRGEPHPFYASDESEGKTSGRQRRSIGNFDAMAAALRARYANVAIEHLEGTSLAFQIALFRIADIVIAQHGAALANLIWARSGIDVFEVVWIDRSSSVYLKSYFGALVRCLQQIHHEIAQPGAHGDVDIDDMVRLLDGAVGEFNRRRGMNSPRDPALPPQ